MAQRQNLARACAKCGGETIRAAISAVGGPQLFPWGARALFRIPASRLYALTCTVCGFTEFYAQHPERLRPGTD